MYALFSSFSPQIFDRLFDKINKYFEHVFKSYLNKIWILFIIITHSTTLDTESLKNVSGGRILTEMEQNFTSKMILLKNVSAFKSINTRKKKIIYIHVYNET